MKTKSAFLISFLLVAIIANTSDGRQRHGVYIKRQLLDIFIQADTTKKPVSQTFASGDLKSKMLGIWKDVEGENATFEIKTNSIYYFEHDAAYKYSLTGNVMNIKFPDCMFTGKVSFVNGTMVINSKEFGISKYKRMK